MSQLHPGETKFTRSVRVRELVPAPMTLPGESWRTSMQASIAEGGDGTVDLLTGDYVTGNLDIYLARSTDHGLSFPASRQVNLTNDTADQVMPWLSLSPGGRIDLVFYDYDRAGKGLMDAVYGQLAAGSTRARAARSCSRGSTATPSLRAARTGRRSSSNYLGIDSTDRLVALSWTGNGPACQDVFSATLEALSRVASAHVTDEQRTRPLTSRTTSRRAAPRRRHGHLERHRLHGDREVARPAEEGEAGRRDLLRLVRRRRRRRRSAGDVRLQRRPGRLVRVSAPRRGWPQRVAFPAGRHAPGDAAAARAERGVLARVRRPRLRRSGRDGIQPGDRADRRRTTGEGRHKKRRRDRPEGVLRAEARPRVAVRVHGPLALEPRPLGIARLHRGRELRRLSRRTPGAHAPGDGRDRAQRGDPDLARARDLDARPERLRRPRLGRPAADDGGRGRASRPLARLRAPARPRRRAARGRGVRHRRLRPS